MANPTGIGWWPLILLVAATLLAARAPALAGRVPPDPARQQDSHLTRRVTFDGQRRPLSKLLEVIQERTGVPLSCVRTVPNEPVFAASNGAGASTLLRQLRLLLSDDDWRYQWANRRIATDITEYRLWRTPVDPQERHAYEERRLRERLAYLLDLLQAGPEAWDRLREEDPDLAARLRQPMFRAMLKLTDHVSSDQLVTVLCGQPLTLSVADMAPEEQALVRQSVGGLRGSTVIESDGSMRTDFDVRDLESMGEVVIRATRSHVAEPNALSLHLSVFTSPAMPGQSRGGSGADVLYPRPQEEFARERETIAAQRRKLAGKALSRVTPGARTVTIPAGLETGKEEPVFAAYLREFARQTRLTVLGKWPAGAKEPKTRLARGIVRRPVGEALDTLCAAARCEWVREGRVVRIRYKEIPEMPRPIGEGTTEGRPTGAAGPRRQPVPPATDR
jgi:hypothetical protein